MALNHVDKAGLVKRLAQDIDKLSDERLGVHSEPFQEKMLKELLLPLCRELMWENRQRYVELLVSESRGNFGSSERSLERGSVVEVVEDRRATGTNFAKSRHPKVSGFTDGVVEA